MTIPFLAGRPCCQGQSKGDWEGSAENPEENTAHERAICRRLDLKVPDQLAVIGVDNEDVICERSSPALSSIPCDCERIGYQAAARLKAVSSGQTGARQLLTEADIPVARIAALSGFSTHPRFNSVFRVHTGQAPLTYRTRRRACGTKGQ